MNIAFDISPLKGDRADSHKVRGSGFYVENLKKALEQYDNSNKYTFFARGDKLPKNIDLVHYPYFEPFFLTLPFKKLVPTVVTVHDLTPLVFPEHFPAGIKGNIKWQIQKKSLLGCQAIVTDSENSKKDIGRFTNIPGEKIHVVYLAPAPEFKKLPARQASPGEAGGEIKQKYHLPDIFVLYVGDVTWNKNLPKLLQAIKTINIPLVMVGKALVEDNFDKNNRWNQDLIKVQEECRRNKKILRLGFVPEDDLAKIYNQAHVLTMPSLYEGFGLPVLEALACGCPVITSRNSSLKEISGESAIYIDPENIDNITSRTSQILNLKRESDEYKKLQQAGMSWVAKFSWEKTAKETINIYNQVHSQGRALRS